LKEKRLSIAVIGAGHMGRLHAQKLERIQGVELAAVVDRDPARGKIGDFRQALSQIQAAVIAVPTDQHHEIARACLDKGVHVLIEKPMTVTLEQADELISSAARKNLVLQVGHVERYNRAFAALTARMDKPLYIEAERLSAFKQRGSEVDVVLDLMIHDLDLVLALAKSKVTHVSACGFQVLTRDIDIANARVEFANGCVGNLSASRVSQAALRKLRVFQPDLYVSADLQAGKLRYVRQVNGAIEEQEESHAGGDALAVQMENFVNAVRDKSPVAVDGAAGREALHLGIEVGRLVRERLRKFA
jgi:predicted dehydrogenase